MVTIRLLKFNVDAQRISKDPNCDFDRIVAGTTGYLRAHFTFSSEWDNCIKIARFWRGDREQAIKLTNNECDIPPEVLTGRTFKVGVIGKKDGLTIPTNKVTVRQEVNK